MKKAILFLCAALCALAVIVYDSQVNERFQATGRYLETAEGGAFIVRDDTETSAVESLLDKSGDGGLFDGLESGDRIQITYTDPTEGPRPHTDWVRKCELLAKGTLDDIPEEALTALEDLGYDFGRHVHQPAAGPQTVEAPVSGYCGNTVTKVTADGEEYAFWGSDSVALTDILENLAYVPEICRCPTEYAVDTEFGSGYGVNLTESFARCEGGQASLTAEQAESIRGILERNCGHGRDAG